MSRYAITTCTSQNYQRYSDAVIIAKARCQRALRRLRDRVRLLEFETDPEVLEAVHDALDDVFYHRITRRAAGLGMRYPVK